MAALGNTQEWLARNYRKASQYAGKWIAVSGSGIVETAPSLDALTKKLSEEQKSELLLTRIPTRKEAASLVF